MARQLVEGHRLVHAVEELADVELEEPGVAASVSARPGEGGLAAFAFAAGIAVENGGALEHRLAHVHQGVVQDALGETGGADEPLLGIEDAEVVIAADRYRASQEVLAELRKVAVQVFGIVPHVGLRVPAAAGFPKREAEVIRLGDLLQKMAEAFHGEGARTFVSTPARNRPPKRTRMSALRVGLTA
jgi:hypothetical protein